MEISYLLGNINKDLMNLRSCLEILRENQANVDGSQTGKVSTKLNLSAHISHMFEFEFNPTVLSPFSTWRICSREQAKSECDWLVMSSVFVASQSSCFFLCSREQIRQVENQLKILLPW